MGNIKISIKKLKQIMKQEFVGSVTAFVNESIKRGISPENAYDGAMIFVASRLIANRHGVFEADEKKLYSVIKQHEDVIHTVVDKALGGKIN